MSEVGFGAWGIGARQWLGAKDDDSLRALERAVELGVDFVDTALAYGDGHSEKLVGQVARRHGGRVRVATKIPPKNRRWPARRWLRSIRGFRPRRGGGWRIVRGPYPSR